MFRYRWRDYFENILVAVFLALFVRTFILTGYKVPSVSMAPNLLPGDFIFSYRLPYGFKVPLTQIKIGMGHPKHGDVVVFTFPEQPRVSYVKRVIGLPGDRIEMQNNELILNGEKLNYLESSVQSLTGQGADLYNSMIEADGNVKRTILLSKSSAKKPFGPLVVPPGEVFLLGDNRDTSDDSRYWGTVPLERIEGQVFLIWLSLDWNQKWADNQLPSLRQDRIFTTVH